MDHTRTRMTIREGTSSKGQFHVAGWHWTKGKGGESSFRDGYFIRLVARQRKYEGCVSAGPQGLEGGDAKKGTLKKKFEQD